MKIKSSFHTATLTYRKQPHDHSTPHNRHAAHPLPAAWPFAEQRSTRWRHDQDRARHRTDNYRRNGALTVRKSTVIATCLINSGMNATLDTAESLVHGIFDEHFPSENFVEWNTDIPENVAQRIISSVGCAQETHVLNLIRDL